MTQIETLWDMLDIRMYQVEFADGEVTELTVNTIAESMYTQCNADGNIPRCTS